jgi:pimeloyl-ACP methyl ester carboxylesterase
VVRKEAIPELTNLIHEHFDSGTKRAVLGLYRDADPEKFVPVAAELGSLSGPSLVIWGDADPYIPARFGDALADMIGGEARVEHLPDAGHWPWLDRPDIVETVTNYIAE